MLTSAFNLKVCVLMFAESDWTQSVSGCLQLLIMALQEKSAGYFLPGAQTASSIQHFFEISLGLSSGDNCKQKCFPVFTDIQVLSTSLCFIFQLLHPHSTISLLLGVTGATCLEEWEKQILQHCSYFLSQFRDCALSLFYEALHMYSTSDSDTILSVRHCEKNNVVAAQNSVHYQHDYVSLNVFHFALPSG